MKNIYKFLLLAFVIISITACSDNGQNPLPIDGNVGPFGAFVRLDITSNPVLDVTDIANTSFGGTITTPSNNVASWDVVVRRVSGGAATNFVPLLSITSFPGEFKVTPASLAAAFGLTVADLQAGDRFDFEATSTGTDGSKTTFDDLSSDLGGNTGEAQGYRFNTFISCPFSQADAIGTYDITSADNVGFELASSFVVIAGSNAGEIVMVDPIGHLLPGDAPDKYNVTIKVDVNSGQAIVDSQPAYDSSHPLIGTPYGPGKVDGGGFVFSCVGAIVLNLRFTVAAGSFGSTPFVAQKR